MLNSLKPSDGKITGAVVINTHNPNGGGQLSEENFSVLNTTLHTIIGESDDSTSRGVIVADKLMKMIIDSNLNKSSPYPLGAEQLRSPQLIFLQKKSGEENLDYQLFEHGGTHSKENVSIDPVEYVSALTIEEIREKVEQVVSSEKSNTIKIDQLKKIEEKHYKSLIGQLAYEKSEEELKDLVIVLKDLGYLTTKLGELSELKDKLKYYTEAAVFYQYVITIVDERLSAKGENEFTEKMLTDSYQQLTYIQQLIYSAVDGVPKHAPIVQVESNGNTQLLSSLRSKVELELFQNKVDAANQAEVQMPLEEQARSILFKLRKHVEEEIVTIESNRIQSVKAGKTGGGEPQQQEQETHYVKKTRKLFEKIATDMGNFLKKLYEESEAELGERPCEYAVIGLGSMALKQITPYSDLEFAILTENEDYKKNNDPKIKEYFKNLSHLVNFKMINLGESIIPKSKYDLDMSHLVHVAVNFDLGGKTPLGRIERDKPYELIQTVYWMLHYVRNEGDKASHIDKCLPYILENVSYVHGDEKLVETYKGKVTEFLHDKNKDNLQGRLNCEIRAIKILEEGAVEINYFQQTLGLKPKETAFKGDVDKLQPKLFDTGGRLFDVKQEIYRLPDRMVYNLGLYYGIEGESSWDTVDKLASQGIISPQAAIYLKSAITFSTTLRLKTYAHHKAQNDDMAIFPKPAETESELKEQAQQIFHLSEEDLREQGGLFKYFYTALPLHERLKDFCDQYQTLHDESRKTFFKNTKFYVDDSINKGLIHYRLAQYKEAQSNLEKALHNPQNQDNLLVRNTLGAIYNGFGNSNHAIEQFEYCLNISKRIYQDKSHPAIADSLSNLGIAYDSKGQYDQAIKCYEESLKMNELFYQDQPNLSVVSSLSNLGTAYYNKGQYDQAIECFENGLKLRTADALDDPKKESYLSIATFLNNLGSVYDAKGQYDQAIKSHEESLKKKQLIYKKEPHSDVAATLNNLGIAYFGKGQYDQAIKYHERNLKMINLIYKEKPHPDVANSLNNLGSAYVNKGQYDQAIKYYEESLKINKLIHKEEPHPDVASSLNNLGEAYREKGQYDQAIQYYEESLEMKELIYKETPHSCVADSLNNLGIVYKDKGQYDLAIENYEKSLQTSKAIYGKEYHPAIADSLNNLGEVYRIKGQYDQAIQCHEESLEMKKVIYKGGHHPSVANSLNNLGAVYYNKEQYDQAIKYYEESLKIKKLIYKEGHHSSVANSLNNLGIAYHKKGQYDQAIKYYEKSLKMKEGIYGKDHHPAIADSLNNLGSAHYYKGQYDQAIKCHQDSLKMQKLIYQKQPHPSVAGSLNNLGNAYYAKGQYDQAIKHISQALQILSKFKDYSYQNTMQNFIVNAAVRASLEKIGIPSFVAAPIALVAQVLAKLVKLMPTNIYDSLFKVIVGFFTNDNIDTDVHLLEDDSSATNQDLPPSP